MFSHRQDRKVKRMIELLKDYLKRLGKGEPLETVRADFVQNFKDVDASEINSLTLAPVAARKRITKYQNISPSFFKQDLKYS